MLAMVTMLLVISSGVLVSNSDAGTAGLSRTIIGGDAILGDPVLARNDTMPRTS